MYYYGQSGQDSIIRQFFKSINIEKGVFVDVGALDGVKMSNTYLLESEDKWAGICIEAHPDYGVKLKKNRKCKTFVCAAGDRNNIKCKFRANYIGSLSTLNFDIAKNNFASGVWGKAYCADKETKKIHGYTNGTIEVTMRTIDSIIEDCKFEKVNFLTIDIDGSEIYAFKKCSLDRWQPELLCLEHTILPNEISKFASDYGYYFARKIGADSLFVKDTRHIEIIQKLQIKGVSKFN